MNAPIEQPSKWRARLPVILLAGLFLAPVIGAWWLHSIGSIWRPENTINHGTLVIPPRPLELSHPLYAPDGKPLSKDYLRGKWTLVYIGCPACGASCVSGLYKMRQVRLAQGENMQRVQRLFLLVDSVTAPADALEDYPEMDVAVLPGENRDDFLSSFTVEGIQPQGAERVYLVDPMGNLMMYYSPDAEPSGMLKDLQRLLKYSSAG